MYVGLHNHTAIGSNSRGFFDSINKIEDMVDYAKQIGMCGLAITDHESLTAHIDLLHYVADKKKENPEEWKDFKPICGNEIYLTSKQFIDEKDYSKLYHFILIAKDLEGYKQLIKLSTKAWCENYFVYAHPRTPTWYEDLFDAIKNNPGHLIGASACLGSQLDRTILEEYSQNGEDSKFSLAKKFAKTMNAKFGQGNFFMEMQPSNQEEQIIVNKVILNISKELNIPYVISSDSHYLKKEDREIHKAFLLSDDKGGAREVDDFYNTTYIMSEEEVHQYMDEYLGYENVEIGLKNTLKVYDECVEYSLDKPLNIPYKAFDTTEPDETLYKKHVKNVPLLDYFYNSKHDCDRHMCREILNKLEEKPEEFQNKETYEALHDCLNSLIVSSEAQHTQWSGYLMVCKELIKTVWESGSLCGVSRGCFIPNSQVGMADGTSKNIQEVKIGDKVFTHLGNIRNVIDTKSYYVKEPLYTLSIQGTQDITCTNNHKFWAIPSQKCIYKDNCVLTCKKNCNKKELLKPRWIEAKDLRPNDMVAIPRYKYNSKENEFLDLGQYIHYVKYNKVTEDEVFTFVGNNRVNIRNRYKRFIKIDSEFLYFLGVYIGDGWVRSRDSFSEIGIAFNSETIKDGISLKRIEKYLESLDITYTERRYKNKKLVQLVFANPFLGAYLKENCGEDVYSKHIPEGFLYDNKEEMESLLFGLLSSDGHINKQAKYIAYDTVNYNLAYQVSNLLSYLGLYSSISIRPEHDNCKTGYKVRSSGKQLENLSFLGFAGSRNIVQRDKNYFYPRIKDITIKDYEGYVYDLSVEEDTSYTVNNIAVHNSGGGFFLLYMLDIIQMNPLREETKTYYWRLCIGFLIMAT